MDYLLASLSPNLLIPKRLTGYRETFALYMCLAKNRDKLLKVDNTNKNDVIKVLGYPHSKSIKDENTWLYIERTKTRGQMINLGRNVLLNNNVLVVKFDNYGIPIMVKIEGVWVDIPNYNRTK